MLALPENGWGGCHGQPSVEFATLCRFVGELALLTQTRAGPRLATAKGASSPLRHLPGKAHLGPQRPCGATAPLATHLRFTQRMQRISVPVVKFLREAGGNSGL